MQADELKALRKRLSLNQSELAEILGLSTRFVGMMERGEAPIERRTALAVLYVASISNRVVQGDASIGATVDHYQREDIARFLA